jgi:hypothetical protein
MKRLKLKFMLLSAMLATVLPKVACAESFFQGAYPNIHGKSLTTPIGWGAAYGTVYAGVGGTRPQAYSNTNDGAAALGVGIGNPIKNIGLEASIVSLDVSAWGRYAMNFKIHRYLGHGNSVAVGVDNVLVKDSVPPSDGGKSFYVVYSQGVQDKHFIDQETNRTKLHYSIGVGTGRFRDKSPADVAAGKGAHGTAVFGSVAYEMFNQFNVIAEWNGVNLNAGVSKAIMIGKQTAIGLSIGVADITRYSGDRVRLIGGIGAGIMF